MRTFAGMQTFVSGQITLLSKRFVAHFARIRTLTGVGALVDLQEENTSKTAVALDAFVGFFAGMPAHVHFQVAAFDKALVTVRAHVRFDAGVSVSIQGSKFSVVFLFNSILLCPSYLRTCKSNPPWVVNVFEHISHL